MPTVQVSRYSCENPGFGSRHLYLSYCKTRERLRPCVQWQVCAMSQRLGRPSCNSKKPLTYKRSVKVASIAARSDDDLEFTGLAQKSPAGPDV